MRKTHFTLLVSLICSIPSVNALEIGKKLSLKILKTSQSKKTILVNKGRDDGLILEDHAKFYVSEGVIARAVAIELSKKRSVWSIYRVANSSMLNGGELMNLKITPRFKLSNDPLAALTRDNSDRGSIEKQLEEKEFSVYSDLDDDGRIGKSDIVLSDNMPVVQKLKFLDDRTFELWTQLGFQSYSSEVSAGDSATDSRTGSEFFNNIVVGAEKYFGELISVHAFFQYLQASLLSFDGAITDSVLIEGGGGLNLFFFNNPHKVQSLIPFLNASIGFGSVTDSFAGGELVTQAQNTTELQGGSLSFQVGLGFKYHLSNGFGMRFSVDYYQRTDTFQDSVSILGTDEWKRTQSGPRMTMGLSYRL